MQLHKVDRFAEPLPLPTGWSESLLPAGGATSPPDARWIVAANSQCQSQCALWWSRTPRIQNQRVGLIGNYAAANERGASMLLTHACSELRRQGCTLAVGPADGTTWGNYRFVTSRGRRPPFWMEPNNPRCWPKQFIKHQFKPMARYFSAMNSDLDYHDSRLSRVTRRLVAAGVRLRPLSASNFENDLRQIYSVARVAFRQNLLYADLDESQFLDHAQQLRQLAPLNLSWLAEHQNRAVGFLFAAPDFCEEAREGRLHTIVIKTLAVLPSRHFAGLGQLLLAEVGQQARSLGYKQAIHALVRNVASLRNLSARSARPIRKYTLFARTLSL